MNFDFSDDQKALQEHARRFLSTACPRETVREVLDNGTSHDPVLWQAIAEMGFLGAAIPEEYGGLDLGYLELCVIAEEIGRSLAPVPFSSSIYLVAEFILAAGTEEQKVKWLPRLASGETIATFAFAEGVGTVTPASITTKVTGGAMSGTKLPVPDGIAADIAIVAACNGDDENGGLGLYIVDLTQESVARATVSTIDPTRGHAKIVFNEAAAERLGSAPAWPVIDNVYDRAAVLFAFEQIGGADRALEMARDYALERNAFGRPIGSFQALKHMLADMYVAATLARSNAYYAAWALSVNAEQLPQAAAAARVSATQAYQQCAKNNIQVHGGMGFTWEFDCHLYYRRSNLLALTLGGLSMWESRLIEHLRTPAAA